MELWKELLISGLQNESFEFDFINDKILTEILESKCYKVLLRIKQVIEDEKLSDEDCFIKIDKIMGALEEDKVFCDRHDFG